MPAHERFAPVCFNADQARIRVGLRRSSTRHWRNRNLAGHVLAKPNKGERKHARRSRATGDGRIPTCAISAAAGASCSALALVVLEYSRRMPTVQGRGALTFCLCQESLWGTDELPCEVLACVVRIRIFSGQRLHQ